jgi:hypothetical protein
LLNILQLVFGLTYTDISIYLRISVHLFIRTFRDDLLVRGSIPSVKEINLFEEAFAAWHPLLTDCWATMDGLKPYLQQLGNGGIQERYYNDWMHDHYVTSVFWFFPDRTIQIALFNVPGLVHDSQVAEFGNIYEKLENVFWLTGAKCCINLAFGNMQREYLYKSCQGVFGSLALTRRERKLEMSKKAGNIGAAES